MTTVKQLYNAMDRIAPFMLAEKGDNVGLLVGDFSCEVKKVLLSLDITNAAAQEAKEIGAELIISHHPIIYNPLYSLSEKNPACFLLKNDINAICAHTNLDIARGGVNDILAKALGFEKISGIVEVVHKIGNDEYGFGNICTLDKEISPKELAAHIRNSLNCKIVRYVDTGMPIKTLAFCSGGGGSFLNEVLALGGDAYICGDVKHDQFISAKNAGLAIFDAGHFHTETIVLPYLKKILSEEFPNVIFEIASANCDPVAYEIEVE